MRRVAMVKGYLVTFFHSKLIGLVGQMSPAEQRASMELGICMVQARRGG